MQCIVKRAYIALISSIIILIFSFNDVHASCGTYLRRFFLNLFPSSPLVEPDPLWWRKAGLPADPGLRTEILLRDSQELSDKRRRLISDQVSDFVQRARRGEALDSFERDVAARRVNSEAWSEFIRYELPRLNEQRKLREIQRIGLRLDAGEDYDTIMRSFGNDEQARGMLADHIDRRSSSRRERRIQEHLGRLRQSAPN